MHCGVPLVPSVGAVCKQEVGNKQRWPPSVIAAASSSIAIAIYCNLLNCKSVTMNCDVMRFLDCICSLLKQLKLCIEVSLLQGNATLCIKLKLTVRLSIKKNIFYRSVFILQLIWTHCQQSKLK